jgi:hypothetical protein
LGFGASQRLLRRRGLSGVVCFAVDDGVREKQPELVSTVGSAVEDRPGETPKPITETSDLSLTLLSEIFFLSFSIVEIS